MSSSKRIGAVYQTRIALVAACLATTIACAAERIEVFTLKSRLAHEIIPVVEPLAGPGATLTGMGDKLVVKADEQQLLQIRNLLAELDRPPQRLLIEVRHAAATDEGSGGGRLDAHGSDGDSSVTLGRRRNAGVDLEIRAAQTRRDDDVWQRIQALEGRAAYISTGQSVPVYEPSIQIYGNRVHARNRIYYRDATTGFYALPWVNGDTVTLTLRQHADQLRAGEPRSTHQRSETSLSGPRGTWLDVGGSRQFGGAVAADPSRVTRTRRRDDHHIQLRVTTLP